MGSLPSSIELHSFNVGVRPKLCCFDFEESCLKHEQLSCTSTQKNTTKVFLQSFESSNIDEEEEEDCNDSIVDELGISVCETMDIRDDLGPSEIFKEEEVDPPTSGAYVLEVLDKFASAGCSQLAQLYPVSAGDESSCWLQHGNFSKAENISFAQPLPISAPKLVPALKGSRAKEGKNLSPNLRVRWAAEVYDPPVTSSSHSLKGTHGHNNHHHHHHHHHHQRPKSKKDYYKQACSKGMSSRSNVSEKKHSQGRSSLTDPRILRLQALGCSRALSNAGSQSKVVYPVDFSAVDGSEAVKYGGNCYSGMCEPPCLAPQVPLPVVSKAS